MSSEKLSPALGAAAGLGNTSLAGGLDDSEINRPNAKTQARNPAAVREAKIALVRDLLRESLCFARLYAEVGQMLLDAEDDAGVLHALRNFRHAANAACEAGRQIRALREGGAR
jgi:hypothetical protein